tara:strand:+ start:246 stop:530 length:285 start_codon:yes stop_codon:yes gene_type:complete
MKYKMKGSSFYGKNCKCNADSPLKYDFTKAKDYSAEGMKKKGKGEIGRKFAEALTPNISKDNDAKTNIKEIVSAALPLGKTAKVLKTAYNYMKA